MSHRDDRVIFCKTCGVTVNPSQWSNVMGKNGHFKKAHGFDATQAVKSTIWKLWAKKQDQDEEKKEQDQEEEEQDQEEEELYQFENGECSDEEDEEDEEDSSEEEDSTSEDGETDGETDEETKTLLKVETGLGKQMTQHLKMILDQPDEEENRITENEFVTLKNKIFN